MPHSLVHWQDVYDKVEYLSSLGKTQTAAVQRDADIGVAEAERDAGIRVGVPQITWLIYCSIKPLLNPLPAAVF